MLKSIFQPLLTWYLATLKTAGFPVIVLLMTMETPFCRFPPKPSCRRRLTWPGLKE